MKDADPKIDHFDFNEENLLKFNDTRNHSFKNQKSKHSKKKSEIDDEEQAFDEEAD